MLDPQRNPESERGAMAALDQFMAGMNARDGALFAAALNYPHVRFASNRVRIWNTAEEFGGGYIQEFLGRAESGWARSRFDLRDVIESSADKVHIQVQFSRLDVNGNVLASYRSFWIVTRVEGHWGIQARSSFAA